MRTVNELASFAERFAAENEFSFEFDEMELMPVDDVNFLNSAFGVLQMCERTIDADSDCGHVRNGTAANVQSTEENAKNEEEKGIAPATNRGLVKYHGADFRDGWGGFDGGCEASFFGTWDEERLKNLAAMLDEAKQAADDGNIVQSYIKFGPFIWNVWAMGAGVGIFKYKWVMESRGVKLYLHSNPNSGIPGVRVRFGFECLVKTDLFKAVETLKECFLMEGYTVEKEMISRVDMQVLLPVSITEFVEAMQGPRVITRCRGNAALYSNLHSGRIETITLSSEKCELCIYDKLAQLSKADAVYYSTFLKYFLHDDLLEIPDFLTRVEFRVKREMLKRYGIDTFDELKQSVSALLEILTSDWFRILSRDKVRGSENEISDSPIWERTRAAFSYYFTMDEPRRRTQEALRAFRPARSVPSVERVVKQAMGCLASAASVALEKVTDGVAVVKYISELAADYVDILYEKVVVKQLKNEVVRDFRLSKRSGFDCLNEIQQALAPLGFPEFMEFGPCEEDLGYLKELECGAY